MIQALPTREVHVTDITVLLPGVADGFYASEATIAFCAAHHIFLTSLCQNSAGEEGKWLRVAWLRALGGGGGYLQIFT